MLQMISSQRLRTISNGAVLLGDFRVALASMVLDWPLGPMGCELGVCGRMNTDTSSIAASDPAALRQIQILRCAE